LAPEYKGLSIISTFNIICVFFLSGVILNVGGTIGEVRTHWRAFALGLVSILFLTPLVGFIAVNLPLRPVEFAAGLGVFYCTPTTLGVGQALTLAAGGNFSVALALTVTTNILAVFLAPYTVTLVLSTSTMTAESLRFDPVVVFFKLVLTVLLPCLLGALANISLPHVKAFVARHRTAIGLLSNSNLVCLIWQRLSSAADSILHLPAGDIALVIFASSAFHVILLAALFAVTSPHSYLSLPVRERVAVVVMSSQKSAPVAISFIAYMSSDARQQGLLSIPPLCGQLCQLFIGSALIPRLQKLVQSGD
jgi:sodium/bile acid cotransporter 7